jgi:ureidoglycolate hydrolase
MTIMLITALRAAETLAAFHRQRVESTAGEARAYHEVAARRCAEAGERITCEILATGETAENQVDAARRRDLETALKIIERHPIMHGVELPVDQVGRARLSMARDIADALAAERGGMSSA